MTPSLFSLIESSQAGTEELSGEAKGAWSRQTGEALGGDYVYAVRGCMYLSSLPTVIIERHGDGRYQCGNHSRCHSCPSQRMQTSKSEKTIEIHLTCVSNAPLSMVQYSSFMCYVIAAIYYA